MPRASCSGLALLGWTTGFIGGVTLVATTVVPVVAVWVVVPWVVTLVVVVPSSSPTLSVVVVTTVPSA